MTSIKVPTIRCFSTRLLAKYLFCVSLGALSYYLILLLIGQWGTRRVSHDITNEDRPWETVTGHLITGNRHGKDYGLHEHENVLNANEQTNTDSVEYHGRDFLKDVSCCVFVFRDYYTADSGRRVIEARNSDICPEVFRPRADIESRFTFDKRFKNPCWYEGDTLKCLPYFFVIGVKKGGTSTMFSRILKLSVVVRPSFQKEAQFFARHRFGEGSPSNLHLNSHWMNLPGNENLTEPKYVILDYIKHFLPDAKIIVSFRDPITRLYSDYYHEVIRMLGSFVAGPEHFHDIVVDGLRMYRDCFSKRTVRSCVYDPTYYDKTKIQMQLGIYYIYWEELLRVFPRDQILVLQNTDLSFIEPYLKIQIFLGLDPVPLSDVERITNSEWYNSKASGKPPMLNETLRLLYEFYKPFNEKMAALMNDDTFLYKHDIA